MTNLRNTNSFSKTEYTSCIEISILGLSKHYLISKLIQVLILKLISLDFLLKCGLNLNIDITPPYPTFFREVKPRELRRSKA